MGHRHHLLPLGLIACGLSACSEQTFFIGPDKAPKPPDPASILGRVCDPLESNWLADALVYTHSFDDNDKLIETHYAYTDPDGYWSMEGLPAETDYTFYVQNGDETLEEIVVWLEEGQHKELEEPDCFDPLQLDVAVITGDYDDFEDVLANMGFANYQLINGLDENELVTFLSNGTELEKYDIIFFNGGHVEEDVIYDSDGSIVPLQDEKGNDLPTVPETIIANLQAYVSGGGTAYASDWAYDVVETAWPAALDFVGDDTVPDAAQLGEYDFVNAAVSDAALADWLGTNYVDVEYDLPVWPPIESAEGYVSVHLSGNVQYRQGQDVYNLAAVPMLASFSSGDGKVAYSTFRVARNASQDIMLVLQYMMYSL
jgi:hypothetical protein